MVAVYPKVLLMETSQLEKNCGMVGGVRQQGHRHDCVWVGCSSRGIVMIVGGWGAHRFDRGWVGCGSRGIVMIVGGWGAAAGA